MRVFISSVISGFEEFREAAAAGIQVLRHTPIRAEDYGASTASPQQACLQGVRDSDLTVVLLGRRYGAVQASGKSATHEEYLEGRDRGRAIVLVQDAVEFEPRQAELVQEVKAWTGQIVEGFETPDQLRDAVTRALAQYEISRERVRVDVEAMASRARAIIPTSSTSATAALALAVVAGPEQQLIRPAALEEFGQGLRRRLVADATLIDPAEGTDIQIRDNAVRISQARRGISVAVDAAGTILLVEPAIKSTWGASSGVLSLIEEDLREQIERAVKLAGEILDEVDPVRRSSDVVISAGLIGGSWLPWRTRAEHAAEPNQAPMGRGVRSGGRETVYAALVPPRRARGDLIGAATAMAEDLTAVFRQQVRP